MRPICTIAKEIQDDWSKKGKGVNYAAVPYLQAMFYLSAMTDRYVVEDGYSIVSYFLANAQKWTGPKAKEIKKELNGMLKNRT